MSMAWIHIDWQIWAKAGYYADDRAGYWNDCGETCACCGLRCLVVEYDSSAAPDSSSVADADAFGPPLDGNYACMFDGSASIKTPSSSQFAFGTGDFTVEAWVYPVRHTIYGRVWFFNDDRNCLTTFNYDQWSTYFGGGSETLLLPIVFDQWHHWATTRSSGVLRWFHNGEMVYEATNNESHGARALYLGEAYDQYFKGNVAQLRVISGTALYTTAPFAPPAQPLTAVAGTSLLTCQSPIIADNSSYNTSLTNLGGAVYIDSPSSSTNITSDLVSGHPILSSPILSCMAGCRMSSLASWFGVDMCDARCRTMYAADD